MNYSAAGNSDTADFGHPFVADIVAELSFSSRAVYSGLDFSEIFKYQISEDAYYDYVAGGDINNDGFSELIFGAASWTTLKKSVKIVSRNPPENIEFPLTDIVFCEIVEKSLVLGDVNGDGYDDVAIKYHPYFTSYIPYVINIMSGKNGKILSSISLQNAVESWAVGNFDNDVQKELVLGVPTEPFSVGNVPFKGKVYVYDALGTNPTQSRVILNTYITLNNQYLQGTPAYLYFGRTVATGDIGGDSKDDIIVGFSGWPNNLGFATIPGGRVFAYDGANGQLMFVEGQYANNYRYFGEQVATIEDLNGDGKKEVVESLFYSVTNTNSPPSYADHYIRLFIRNLYVVVERINGDYDPNLGFKLSLDTTGDIDNDGISDFVMVVPTTSTTSNFGQVNSFETFVISGRNGNRLYKFNEYKDAKAIKDINFDGFDDLLLKTVSGGGTVVRSGSTGEIIYNQQGLNYLGENNFKIGDLNNDGIEEIAITSLNAVVRTIVKSLVGTQKYGFTGPRLSPEETMDLRWEPGTGVNPYYNGKLVIANAMPGIPVSILASYGSRMDYFTGYPNNIPSYLNANELIAGFPAQVVPDGNGRAEYPFSLLLDELNPTTTEVYIQGIQVQGTGADTHTTNGLMVDRALVKPTPVYGIDINPGQATERLLGYINLCGYPYAQLQINLCNQVGAVAGHMRVYNRDGTLAGDVLPTGNGAFIPSTNIIRQLYYPSGLTPGTRIAFRLTIGGTGTLVMKHKNSAGAELQTWAVHGNNNNMQVAVPRIVVSGQGDYLEITAGTANYGNLAINIWD